MVEKELWGMLNMLERFKQALQPWIFRGDKGTGYGSDRYHILSQAPNLKGVATVIRKSNGSIWASSYM